MLIQPVQLRVDWTGVLSTAAVTSRLSSMAAFMCWCTTSSNFTNVVVVVVSSWLNVSSQSDCNLPQILLTDMCQLWFTVCWLSQGPISADLEDTNIDMSENDVAKSMYEQAKTGKPVFCHRICCPLPDTKLNWVTSMWELWFLACVNHASCALQKAWWRVNYLTLLANPLIHRSWILSASTTGGWLICGSLYCANIQYSTYTPEDWTNKVNRFLTSFTLTSTSA